MRGTHGAPPHLGWGDSSNQTPLVTEFGLETGKGCLREEV